MPKGGQRRARQKGKPPHRDKYAAKAAASQTERNAFDDQWSREHPTPPTAAAQALTDSEEEEAI